MTADTRQFVVAVSGRDDDSLTTQARDLARYLGDARREPARVAFSHAVTLPAVVKTLLCLRETHPHRLACTAGSVEEAADRLRTYVSLAGDPRALAQHGIYRTTVDRSVFDEPDDAGDRAYAARLAAEGRHRQLARLWAVGYPVDWARIYPDLAGERPVYLPPTRLSRRRFWPDPATPPAGEPAPPAVEPAPPAATGSDLLGDLGDLPDVLRRQRLGDYLQRQIGLVLGYPDGELPRTDQGFFDLGMTSIHLETVRSAIVRDLAVDPEPSAAFDHPTITEFVRYLADRIEPATTGDPTGSVLAGLDEHEIDSLSATDLERLLGEVV
ncbi:acyl transferase domain-containing protein [Actinoplanes octamycinicus]|uniref:Acyl transferase domain-containing protein n=1 Tax=Actinoplanes octamycinicus TaxID=135948 RepID=A0A7W7GVN4_9ACTN|nr:acyl carrier protein [Actinoplanes octamycinicus]MBB4739057.1 acyl transferase domain-containing protein [Actinoplanes octamycinicus]GIE60188.1 hypothetical protein Aoc01nite_55900 [Actinoplanes octamycinicus]